MSEEIDFINNEINKDLNKEGLFWRISRTNTFVDLLMLMSHKFIKKGVRISDAIEVIIIAIKAIINMKFGLIDYSLDHEKLIEILHKEEAKIKSEIRRILINCSSQSRDHRTSSLTDELLYFKVLNNLNINNYSIDSFENILEIYIHYIQLKLKKNNN